MCATEDSLLLKGLHRSMISHAASGPGAIASAEGWSHSYSRTYDLNTSRFDILCLRGPVFASLDENDNLAAISD